MGGYVGRWWLCEEDGWLCWEMGGIVTETGGDVGSAPAGYGSTLGSNPDISRKYKNGRHKQRSSQHTLARQKNIQKIINT